MHELSIAVEIVSSIEEEIRAYPGASVASVKVRVGALSGVVPDALSFAWECATADTRVAGAGLDIEPVEAAAWCDRCGAERELGPSAIPLCPVCGEPTPRITRGKELEIVSAELLEPD